MGSIMRRPLALLLLLTSTTLYKSATALPHFGLNIQTTHPQKPEGLGSFVHNATTTNIMTIQHFKRHYGGGNPPPCEDDFCSFISPPGLLQCEPPPPDKYRDSHHKRMKEASKFFCDRVDDWETEEWTKLPIAKTVQIGGRYAKSMGLRVLGYNDEPNLWQEPENNDDDRETKESDLDDVYDIRIEVVEGCKPAPPLVNDNDELRKALAKPVPDKKCHKVFSDAWKHCNNKGRGGSLQAGCFRYSIRTRF